MSDASAPFVSFINACVEVLGLPPQTIEGDRFMVKVEDRWVELRYSRDDDRVIFAAIACVAPPDRKVCADLISRFNVYYLFNGGFSLVQGYEGFIYLCRPHQLSMLDPRRMREDLVDFANAVAAAGSWYLRSDSAQSAGPVSMAGSGEGAQFQRI